MAQSDSNHDSVSASCGLNASPIPAVAMTAQTWEHCRRAAGRATTGSTLDIVWGHRIGGGSVRGGEGESEGLARGE